MASPTGSARSGARGRAPVLALLACVVGLAIFVAILSREDASERAPLRATPRIERAAAPVQPQPDEVEAAPASREVVERAAPRAAQAGVGPFLVGRVVDERGAALVGVTPTLTVRGPLGQVLSTRADLAGDFGPLRLRPGRWTLTAQADGHRSALRELELAADANPEPLELVLPRVVGLTLVCTSSRDDLSGLAALLTATLAVEGEADVERRALAATGALAGEEPAWRAHFEPRAGRAATLELLLGDEPLVRRAVPAGQAELRLELDARDLRASLVRLEVELRDPAGAPLGGLGQVLLRWGETAHLIAGQPGEEPWRARFEACPPGPARLVAVDVDGRRGEAELFVPHGGPARVELALELAAPAHE